MQATERRDHMIKERPPAATDRMDETRNYENPDGLNMSLKGKAVTVQRECQFLVENIHFRSLRSKT